MRQLKNPLFWLIFIFFYARSYTFSEDLLSEFKMQIEKFKTPDEKRAYVKSLGIEKAILLGNQVWEEIDSENAYWIGYYGIVSRWRENPYEIVLSVPIIYPEESKLNAKWKEMITKSLWEYTKTSDISTESAVMDMAIEFTGNANNPPKDRGYVLSFIGDLWFNYFENAQRLPREEKTKTFYVLNSQVEKIIKGVTDISGLSQEMKEKRKYLLERLYKFYTRPLLPSEFTENINFSKVRSLVKEAYLSETK